MSGEYRKPSMYNNSNTLTHTGKKELAKQITVALVHSGGRMQSYSSLQSPEDIAKTACDIVDALDKEMSKRYPGL